MVCATPSNNIMTQPIMNHHQQQMMTPKQQQQQQREEDDDFDMAMDEDDDSEEDSSQDDETSASSTPNANSNNNTNNKRPVTQALFLNFTSDLSPQKSNKKKTKPKKQTAYRVNGVNILNRNNLDSKTAIERIQRRRENHNHVERRRRDNINNTIFELSSVVPNAIQPGQKLNKGNILKLSLDYIKDLQAENNALKERLAQFTTTTSRPSSISPHLPTAAIPNSTNVTATTTTTAATTAAVIPAVDETFALQFSHQQQPSPSAPNSPNRFIRNNTTFTQQPQHHYHYHQHHHPQQQQQSVSVPSSPVHTIHNHMNMPKDDNTLQMNNLPPPLALPPPHPHLQQQQQQQHLQNVFSSMSVSSNASSASSTPILSATVLNTSYPPYPSPRPPSPQNNYPPSSTSSSPQQQIQTSIYIPQPPQLYNNPTEIFNTQQPQQHKQQQQQGLRPLLPATKPSPPTTIIQQHQTTSFLPALRMSGYEKIYGNVCRY